MTTESSIEQVTVAAFDFDGTLTTGGSVWRFLVEVAGRRRVALAVLRLSWRLAHAAVAGGAAADDVKEALFRMTLAGRPVEPLKERAAVFGRDHYLRHARRDVRRRLEWHRLQGHRLLIVSASPELYLDAVGQELRVDAVVATRLEVDAAGRLTGNYEGRNCRDEEKILRVRAWSRSVALGGGPPGGAAESESAVDRNGGERGPYIWAYGNSAGDTALLAGADVGVDVGRLGVLGHLRAFPRLKKVSAAQGS